jgi:predicted  nucleic acid-binding Zn-ribbon protein
MPNPNARIDRLEDAMGRAFNAIEALADKEEKLDDAITLLLDAQIKTEQRFKETADHLREIDKASRERDRALDERVDRLVSAIGELVQRLPRQ